MSEAQLIPFEDVGDEVPVGRVLSVAMGNPNWPVKPDRRSTSIPRSSHRG
jgi:hypothetical protein